MRSVTVIRGWPAYEGLFRLGSPRLAPKNLFVRSFLEGVRPSHIFVRGPKDPVSLALVASYPGRALLAGFPHVEWGR